jgi:hypothetical protein
MTQIFPTAFRLKKHDSMNNTSMQYNAHVSTCSSDINLFASHSSHSFSVSIRNKVKHLLFLYLVFAKSATIKSFTADLFLRVSYKLVSGECLLPYNLQFKSSTDSC